MKHIFSKKIVTTVVLMFVSIILSTSYYQYSKNNLWIKKEWKTLKIENRSYVMGSIQYFLDRYTLAQNKLKLNSYYGHNGIYLKNKTRPDIIDLDYEIDNHSYFYIILIDDLSTFGVRISRNKKAIPFFFESKDGKFIKKKEIEIPINRKDSVKLSFIKNQLTVGSKSIKLPKFFKLNSKVKIIFKGGDDDQNNSVLIDNISIHHNGNITKENFSNNFNKYKVYLFFSIMFLPFLILILLKDKFTNIILSLLMSYITVLSCVYIFDYYYWSTRFYYQLSPNTSFSGKDFRAMEIENLRKKYFFDIFNINDQPNPGPGEYFSHDKRTNSIENTNCKSEFIQKGYLRENYNIDCNLQHKKTFRIAFIGSSQTAGSGSSQLNKSFVQLFTKHLYQKILTINKCNLNVTNMAVSGSNTVQAKKTYTENYINNEYDAIFINFGFNDNQFNYTTNLQNLIVSLSTPQKFLIGEPSRILNFAPQRYILTEKLAFKMNIPFISTKEQEWVKNNNNYGFLFWDNVHLSDLGHRIMAKTIFEQSIPHLKMNYCLD
jgi:lysophospholipase L1-like esterase